MHNWMELTVFLDGGFQDKRQDEEKDDENGDWKEQKKRRLIG